VTIAVLVVGVGCDGKKAEECKAITDAANADLTALKAAAANKPSTTKERADAARATADAADKLVVNLGKKGPTTAELQKASGDYQAAGKAMAIAARDLADTLDGLAKMEAKIKPEAADPDRKILTADQDKLKKRCTDKPAPECKKLTPLLVTAATVKAEQLEKMDGDLSAIVVKDAALGSLVTTLRGSVASLAKTLRDQVDTAVEMKALDVKGKTDALDAAIAKEAPISASLKTFCAK
jgi:hypothetical protein